MRKSCLIQLILLLLIGVVLSLSIRRWLDRREAQRQKQMAAQVEEASEKSGSRLIERLATLVSQGKSGTTSPTEPPPARGIEGLALETSRPLMVDSFFVRGLVVDSAYVLMAGNRVGKEEALLYQLATESGTITQARRIDSAGYVASGGMTSAGELVWLALNAASAGDDSLILGIAASSTCSIRRP